MKPTEKQLHDFKDIIINHKQTKGALLPILHKAQDTFGYIPLEIQELISEELKISNAHIGGVVSFYEMFYAIPTGKYHIGICSGTSCHINQSKSLLLTLENTLATKQGETTKDQLFTIVPVRCIGQCDKGPNLLVNDKVYNHMDKIKLNEIVEEIKKDIN